MKNNLLNAFAIQWFPFTTQAAQLPSSAGVYGIWCAENNKIYIGSAAGRRGLRGRFVSHLSALRLGKHKSAHLQNAFDKYGVSEFYFAVLQILDCESVLKVEQQFLDMLKPCDRSIGFNTCPTAHSRLGVRHTEETKIKLSFKLKNLSPEVRARVSAARLPVTEEFKRRCSEAYAKPYRLEKDGVIVEGRNISSFARAHGLDSSHVGNVINGKWHSVGGWHLPGRTVPAEKWKQGRQLLTQYRASLRRRKNLRSHLPAGGYTRKRRPNNSPFRLMKDGVIYEGTNLAKFARDHKLAGGTLNAVQVGRRHQYQGWTLPENPLPAYRLLSPTGGEHIVTNISAFCKENDLHRQCVQRLVLGQRLHHKGWTLSTSHLNSTSVAA